MKTYKFKGNTHTTHIFGVSLLTRHKEILSQKKGGGIETLISPCIVVTHLLFFGL